MIGKLSKGIRIAKEEGFRETTGRTFRYYFGDVYDSSIREYFPAVPVGYNGVNVCAFRVSDVIMPENNRYIRPSYEAAICRQLRLWNLVGCDVCVLGAGWGVTSVVAAYQTGTTGQVISYEASSKYVSRAKETAALNDCADRIIVRHGCVGPAINVYGEDDAPTVQLDDLPDADCYIMDIEGAEPAVLDGLSHRPERLLVESHGLYGSSTDAVKNQIREMDYSITSCDVAESGPNVKKKCKENDVYVISAIRK
jgi:hypothetical protein